MPTSGRSTSSVVASAMTVMFSSVCDATCPTTSPVTSARARHLRAMLLRDPQHQAPVDHDAQRRRHRQQDLLLQLAEGHEHEPRAQLVRGQERRDLAHLLLRGARQNRIAVEVDEQHRAAAPHHPIRRHGRVDAARQQARHAPARAGRQPAGARLLAEEVERLVGQHLDVDRSAPAASRFTRQPFACLMRPPTSRSICGEVSGKRLSARRADTRNDSTCRSPRSSRIAGREDVEIERRAPGIRVVGDAEDVPQPLAHAPPRPPRRRDRSRFAP